MQQPGGAQATGQSQERSSPPQKKAQSPRTHKKNKELQKQLSLSATDTNHNEKTIRDNLILTSLNAMLEQIDGTISVPKALE